MSNASNRFEFVRYAARQLVADIDAAQEKSNGWSRLELGESLVREALERCLARLRGTGLVGRENQIASSELWRIAGQMLRRGPLQWHAHSKPRGYAGDDEMLAAIFENRVADEPLAKIFDRYFLSQDAPRAVRGRLLLAADTLNGHFRSAPRKDYRVASVGSGPAIDIVLAVDSWSELERGRAHVRLLDLDQQALDAAAHKLASRLRPEQVQCTRENLFRLARRPSLGRLLSECDVLICLGLFDYLDDDGAAAMLRLFWQSLRSGGILVVGNFAPHCQARAYMEWVGNWYLNYRTRDELARLALHAGIPESRFRIGAEPLGVDLMLTADRT